MKYVQGAVWALLVLAFLAILYLVYRAALAARDAMAGLGKWGDTEGEKAGMAVANSSGTGLWIMARVGDFADWAGL